MLKAICLLATLLVTGCSSALQEEICLRYDGGSPLHGARLLDDWGRGGQYQVVDDRFWQRNYPEGTWVKFKVFRVFMNSGASKIEAVKYKGDCPKQ